MDKTGLIFFIVLCSLVVFFAVTYAVRRFVKYAAVTIKEEKRKNKELSALLFEEVIRSCKHCGIIYVAPAEYIEPGEHRPHGMTMIYCPTCGKLLSRGVIKKERKDRGGKELCQN